MRKKRNLLSRNLSNLRAKISKTISNKGMLETDFRPLSIHENWRQIEDKIYQTFCTTTTRYKQKPIWLCLNAKLDSHSLSNTYGSPELLLEQLIDHNETIWCLFNETIKENEKLWFYEGKIKSIQTIIDETWFYELYLVSKKYEWLICVNHHDILIATGNEMPDKLRKLEVDFKGAAFNMNGD